VRRALTGLRDATAPRDQVNPLCVPLTSKVDPPARPAPSRCTLRFVIGKNFGKKKMTIVVAFLRISEKERLVAAPWIRH
jgi:hypothetical protein